MQDALKTLDQRLHAHTHGDRTRRHSRAYRCRCASPVFFDNAACPACDTKLGYLPDEARVAALVPGPRRGTWLAEGRDELLKFCANRTAPAHCNWMLFAHNPLDLCMACRLNRTIPDLSDADNALYWSRIESAKRRLVSQLIGLGLPVRSKLLEDPEHGVMFDFLRSPPQGPQVLTGHASGLITLNVEEADDARREKIRHLMREPYRTLLGHFRHEIGHYYWDRLVWGTRWLEPFRALFGDERASYADALKRNYELGPPANWAEAHISSYATMHSWEDWAETWAHFLHVVDTLGTALGFGLEAEDMECDVQPFGPDALYAPEDPEAERFLFLLNSWMEITLVMNELAASMGQPHFYPFALNRPVVAKLQFVQMVVYDARINPEL
jgi:hypothetical protein